MEEEISSSTQPSPRARDDQAPNDQMDYFTAREFLHQHTNDGGMTAMTRAEIPFWKSREENTIAAAEYLKAHLEETA